MDLILFNSWSVQDVLIPCPEMLWCPNPSQGGGLLISDDLKDIGITHNEDRL